MSEVIKGIAEPQSAVSPVSPEKAVEAPKTSPPPEQDQATRERWAQLARKEKAIRAQARQLQEQQKALETSKSQLPKDALSPQEWKQRFMQDPASMGFTHDEIGQVALGTPKESFEISQLRQELAELKATQKSSLEQTQLNQKNAYDQAVKQISREVNGLIDGNAEYETIKATESQDAVVSLIEETYKEDGILLSASEAAKQVEEYLLEQALTLAKLSKVQKKLAPPATPDQEQPLKQQQQHSIQARTLTHSMAQQAAPKSLSERERVQRAIAAFKGQSK